jgi:hypothetical protein
MDALDAVEEVASAIASLVKPTQPSRKPNAPVRRALVKAIEVPTRPPCADPSGSGGTTTVYIYRRSVTEKRGNGALYIRVADIGWLLAFAADELALQGIQRSHDQSPPKTANCPAVADLHMEWDFAWKGWEATWIRGALDGVTRRLAVNQLTPAMWDKLKEVEAAEGLKRYYHSTTQRMDGAKALLTMWCAATARGDSAEFDALMPTPEDMSPCGVKRKLATDAYAAVVDAAVADAAGADAEATDVGDHPA